MKTSRMPIRAGCVTPESDDATAPASNGGTKDQENGQRDFATARCYTATTPATEWSDLRIVGNLLRRIGGCHG
jgi:hypothetical protein